MTTLTITDRDLAALLKPVMPFAGTDKLLPVLNSVRVTSQDGYLIASATDRFGLGRVRRQHDIKAGDFAATIPIDAIRRIFTLFKPMRGSVADLTLVVNDDNTMTVTSDTGLDFGMQSASLTLALTDGDFPKVGQIFAQHLERQDEPGPVGLNPALLKQFGHLNETIEVRTTKPSKAGSVASSGPVLVSAGDWFLGCMMPRRVYYEAAETPSESLSWGDCLLDEPKRPAAKRTRKAKADAA